MRIPIHKQREIARLHFHDSGLSSRSIAKSVQLSANTVADLRKFIEGADHCWQELQSLDDDQWEQVLGTKNRSIAQRKVSPDWAWVHAEMQGPDATLQQLWQAWRGSQPDGIGYTQFTEGYRAYTKSLHIILRRPHAPGYAAYLDFAGRRVEISDPNGGPSTFAHVFVGVLGYSNYTFIEAVPTQDIKSWIQCNVNFFNEIGGVPRWVVPDNLKSAVIRRQKDHISLNSVYKACLAFFGTAANPAGPYRPTHKAKVEVGVQIVQRWILFPLRHRKFFSIEDLQIELKAGCRALNAHAFKKMPGSRMDRFIGVEKAALSPLPDKAYEYSEWLYQIQVNNDHHIDLQGCSYSVPHQYVGDRVDVKLTSTIVEVNRKSRLIAVHERLFERGSRSTKDEHRPLNHRHVLDGEPAKLLQWAASVGPNAAKMIEYHLREREDLTNGLKAAQAMRNLARTHTDLRFEEVCAYALPRNITAIKSIRSIFGTSADLRPQSPPSAASLAGHDHVRGPTYYGNSAADGGSAAEGDHETIQQEQ